MPDVIINPGATLPTPVLYVDLDGTIRHCAHDPNGYVNGPDDVAIYEGVPELLARYREAGWRVVAVSNQGGVALGIVSQEECALAMARTYQLCDPQFDKIAYCQHHPSASDPELAQCWCRKPRIGLIVESAYELAAQYPGEYYPPHLALMVGDMDSDAQTAAAANLGGYVTAEEWRDPEAECHPWNREVAAS